MANGNHVTLVGNLTDEPDLRYTPNGVPVASFTIAVNRRFRDPASGDWKDGETSYIRCNVWRQQAENVAESLGKGHRVIVVGRLRQRSWETPEGQKRSVTEVEVDSVGPSLEWAKVQIQRSVKPEGAVPAWAGAAGPAPAENGAIPAIPEEEPPF